MTALSSPTPDGVDCVLDLIRLSRFASSRSVSPLTGFNPG